VKTICTCLFILLASVASLAQTIKPYKTGIDPGRTVFKNVTLKQKIELSINGARFARDQMLDPDSFHVSRVWYRYFAVCMEFRSKNAMGGYVQGAGVYKGITGEKFSVASKDLTDATTYIDSDTHDFQYYCMLENDDKPIDVTEQVKAVLKSDRAKGLE
jgi:hypothetical protein